MGELIHDDTIAENLYLFDDKEFYIDLN